MKSFAELTNGWCPTDQVLILLDAELTYQVPGSTKFKEWFTGRCWRSNCCWMTWYARHWSEWMMLAGRITFWMIGRRVAASRLLTIRKYPIAGTCIYYSKNPLIPLWCSFVMVFGLVAETAFVDLADDARTAGSVDTTKLNWILQ